MSKNALFIVEGQKREVDILKAMKSVLPEEISICSVGANIHSLYRRLKELEFNADIISVLLEMKSVSEEDKLVLKSLDKITYTYLIFDFDIQHYRNKPDEVLIAGIDNVREMLSCFNDETDGTVGKLYINYPMVEAYRDCNNFFDTEYKYRYAELDELDSYKEIVGKRGIRTAISKWNYEDFMRLIDMNLHKANHIVCGIWDRPEYKVYRDTLGQTAILDSERSVITDKRIILVLCSIYLMVADYWGRKLWERM